MDSLGGRRASVVAAWHRRYNVSGTVHCGGVVESGRVVSPSRVEDWYQVLRAVLRTDEVGTIGHFTGAVSVLASSPVADVVSCGFDVHEFWALAAGERSEWQQLAGALEFALCAAGLPYSLAVHDSVLVLE
jgi:hypothetical protein